MLAALTLTLGFLIVVRPHPASAGEPAGDRPAAYVPDRADLVLEILPPSFASLPREPAHAPSLESATAMLVVAARSGDARLAARAERELARLPDPSERSAVLARAWAAQHRHDFSGALQLLDAAIATAPRDAAARALRAQVLLVQGRVAAARSDCAAMVLVEVSAALMCSAAVSMRRGADHDATRALDRWLADAPTDREALRHAYVMRAQLAASTGDASARAWFARALALASDDVRTLAAYARYLRLHGQPREALTLLPREPGPDRLLLERALAASAAADSEAPALTALLAARYAGTRAAGAMPEAREEAEYLLRLANEPARALQLALANLETQRDLDDVALARDAARIAGQPHALDSFVEWSVREKVPLQVPGPAAAPGATGGSR